MNENKEFEHKIDPDLWAEIEEWEKTDHETRIRNRSPCRPTNPGTTATSTRTAISA